MISIFIDESGQFENDLDSGNVVVGGVLVKHQNEEELVHMNERLSGLFKETYGTDYYGILHGETRDRNAQELFIQRLQNVQGVEPVYIHNGSRTSSISSNITNDQTACLLYFNMVNQLVTGSLFLDINMLEEHQTIQIYVASRIAVEKQMSKERKDSFEIVGFTDDRYRKPGEARYQLNNETSLLIHLNRDMEQLGPANRHLHITIKKVSIQYSNMNFPFKDLFYTADIICNQVFKHLRSKRPVQVQTSHKFIYDDIHEHVSSLVRYFRGGDHFSFLLQSTRFYNRYQKHPWLTTYTTYVKSMESSIQNSLSPQEVSNLLHKVSHQMSQGNYSRFEGMRWLTFLESYLHAMSAAERVTYYNLCIQTANHVGDYQKGKAYYRLAMESADQVRSASMVETKIKMMNRYATTCSNAFDFDAAIQITEEAIILQEQILETYSVINSMLYHEHQPVVYDTMLGILHSAKGRYLAFKRDPEAQSHFRRALALLESDPNNKKITISYYIHLLADQLALTATSEEHAAIDAYFHGLDFEQFVNRMQDVEWTKSDISVPFQLFVFIKWYRYRQPELIVKPVLKALAKRLLQVPIEQWQHPWELILFNLAEMLKSYDTQISDELYRKSKAVCSQSTSNMTMRLFGSMVNIQQYKDAASIANFSKLVQSDDIPAVKSYFQLDNISKLGTTSERARYLTEKFTYMYN